MSSSDASPSGQSESALPSEIVQSIAIANATTIASQPAVLANLALANEILNANLRQQAQIAQQQALNLLTLAVVAKSVATILRDDPGDGATAGEIKDLLDTLKSVTPPTPAPTPAPAS